MNKVIYAIGIGFAALVCSSTDYGFAYSNGDLQVHRLESSPYVIESQPRDIGNHIADIAPWEQSPNDAAPYILPPWGLTANDFVVTRQVPLSTRKREVTLNSPSIGSQQKLFISLANSPSFQIYEMSFERVLDAGNGIEFEAVISQALLQNFQVAFKSNEIATVTLADGTQAEFSDVSAVIRSPTGQILENIQLRSNVVTSLDRGVPIGQKSNPGLTAYEAVASSVSNRPLRLAQSQGSCESGVRSHTSQLASSMAPWSHQLSQRPSDVAKAVGWAIGHSAEALGNSLSLEDPIQDISCRRPVQCDERRVSGGSEIRTELFDIPQGGGGSEVSLNYEFYTIPDSIEMYYDGNQILSVGPASGQGRKSFRLPASAQQVGITLRGNNDPDTKWWFEVACSTGLSNNTTPQIVNMGLRNSSERMPTRLALDTSSGNILDLRDIFIVENLKPATMAGKPTTGKFPWPFVNLQSPIYESIWGIDNVRCDRPSTSPEKHPAEPGGITSTDNRTLTLTDIRAPKNTLHATSLADGQKSVYTG